MKLSKPKPRNQWSPFLCAVCMTASNMLHAEEAPFAWRQNDDSLALVRKGGVVWQLNYGKNEPKSCFHPLNTLEGTGLTSFRPEDHPWHRALWFSWKFINGLNYWEEDPETGVSEGITETVGVQALTRDDFSALITINLSYHPPGQSNVLSECRVLEVSAPSIDDGSYTIGWHSQFTAAGKNVILDRNPILGDPNGVGWGGYAGLSVRVSPELENWRVKNSRSHQDLAANKQHALWVDFRGEDKLTGKIGGLAIFDHLDNPRHPTPWYVIAGKEPPFGYLSPAFLYYRSYTLPSRSKLVLRYQILVHSGHSESLLITE